MMKEYGFKNPSNEVFTVFKDELLKADPITVLRKFEVLDWKSQSQKRIQLKTLLYCSPVAHNYELCCIPLAAALQMPAEHVSF